MAHYPKVSGDLCYLSVPDPSDAELWTRWLNDLDVALPLGDEAHSTVTVAQQRGWIETLTEQNHVFTIVERTMDRPIGRCLLFGVNLVDRTAEAGIFVGEKDLWGRGYGTEAMRLLLFYAFGLLNLNSVMIGAFDFNARAIASYRRLGFREIGRRRAARTVAGVAHDLVLMDLLASEFEANAVSTRVQEARGTNGSTARDSTSEPS